MFAAYSTLYVRVFPGNGSDTVMWEASGLRAQLGLGGERPSAVNPCATTHEAGKVYLCLSCHTASPQDFEAGGGGGRRQDAWGRQS